MFYRRSFERFIKIGLSAGMLNYVIRESLMNAASIEIVAPTHQGLDKILNLRQSIGRKLCYFLNEFLAFHDESIA